MANRSQRYVRLLTIASLSARYWRCCLRRSFYAFTASRRRGAMNIILILTSGYYMCTCDERLLYQLLISRTSYYWVSMAMEKPTIDDRDYTSYCSTMCYPYWTIEEINEELQKITTWFHTNKLSLNIKKSNFIIFLPKGE